MIKSLVECREINPQICVVLSNVLEKIRPSSEEKSHVLKFAERIKTEIINALSDMDIPHSVEIHGSVAHDTWLSKDRDIDVFILLSKTVSKEFIKNEVLCRLKQRLKYRFEERYAEHPYLRAYIDAFTVDIVPGFRVGEIISAVDRTPLHTDFLRKNLDQSLLDEVRLLKSFLKGIGAYGAEIRTRGLSGYACELLVIHYGSFLRVLKAFSMEKRIFIDFTETWKLEKALEKFGGRIIIIDPVDKERNVTSNTSSRSFHLIKLASKLFFENPSEKFFFPCTKRELLKSAPLNDRKIVVIIFEKTENVPPDTYWGQIRRIETLIRNYIKNIREIKLYATDVVDSEDLIFLLLEVNRINLDTFKEIQGPPVWASTRDIIRFISEYKDKCVAGPWLKGYRIVFQIRRSESEMELANHLKRFLERVRIKPSFKSFKVITSIKDASMIMKKKGVFNHLVSFANRRFPWMCFD